MPSLTISLDEENFVKLVKKANKEQISTNQLAAELIRKAI